MSIKSRLEERDGIRSKGCDSPPPNPPSKISINPLDTIGYGDNTDK